MTFQFYGLFASMSSRIAGAGPSTACVISESERPHAEQHLHAQVSAVFVETDSH
jgi:hypothetical protein